MIIALVFYTRNRETAYLNKSLTTVYPEFMVFAWLKQYPCNIEVTVPGRGIGQLREGLPAEAEFMLYYR